MTDEAKYAGAVYDPSEDESRLDAQILRVYESMKDEGWRTLQEISDITGDPPSSVSAQLRHLRKKRFGSYVVEKRARGVRSGGLFEYQVLPPGSPSAYAPPERRPTKPFYAGFTHAIRVAAKADPEFAKSPAFMALKRETGRYLSLAK